MPAFSVDPAALRDTAARLRRAADDIAAAVHDLEADLTALDGDWSGDAAEAGSTALRRWSASAGAAAADLRAAAAHAARGADVYDDAEEAVAALWE